MTTVAIIYHSEFGHTRVQAEAVRDGAASVPGTTVHLVPVEDHEQRWNEIDDADAIVFGAPTYMAGASTRSSPSSTPRQGAGRSSGGRTSWPPGSPTPPA